MFFDCIGDDPTFTDIECEGFFAVDIEFFICGHEALNRVPMVRRGNDHRIQGFLPEHLPEVDITTDIVPFFSTCVRVKIIGGLESVIEPFLDDFTDGDDLGIRLFESAVHQGAGSFAISDDSNANAAGGW